MASTVSPASEVQQLVGLLQSAEPGSQQTGLKGLNNLVNKSPGLAQLIDAKIAAPSLCHQLSSSSQDLQIAAASTLTALAKESSENQLAIANAGALPLLKQQMTAPDVHIQTIAVAALGHLAADHQPIALWMASTGTAHQIQLLLQSSEVELQLAAIEAIDSIARSDVQVRGSICTQQTLSILVHLLQAPSTTTQHAAASALANIALVTRDEVNITMVRSGAAAALVQKLDPRHEDVCHQATRALCNLSGDNDECDEAISNSSGVEALMRIFQGNIPKIISAAGKALGNLALYSSANQKKIAEGGVIEECLGLISHRSLAHTLEAACRLLHVLMTDSPAVHLKVASGSGVRDLINLLNHPGASVRHAAAGALSHMLFPRAMPGWQYSNDLINHMGMTYKFQQELNALRAKNRHAHQGDMLVDEMHDNLGFSDRKNSGEVSATATESQGNNSDSDDENQSLVKIKDKFDDMQM